VAETKRIPDLKSLARGYTEKGIEVLGGYINSPEIPPEIKVQAVKIMFERGWGRPNQPVEARHEGEIKITVRQITEGKK
jgi:hypothetical protein